MDLLLMYYSSVSGIWLHSLASNNMLNQIAAAAVKYIVSCLSDSQELSPSFVTQHSWKAVEKGQEEEEQQWTDKWKEFSLCWTAMCDSVMSDK